MITFFASLALLVVGFFTYGKLMEKVFHIDDRPTPAVAHPDGVDYVPMKTWKVFLIQLLNIAGLGPIYGALAGACWGPVVYLWIVFGTILGGGVHDFMSGMMSERRDGASVADIVRETLGPVMGMVMRVFLVVLLVLVGANFSLGPAALLARLTPSLLNVNFWLVVILAYYFIATFLPVDKIIGRLYPIFGFCLIAMAVGISGALLLGENYVMPELWTSLDIAHPGGLPKWAMMFVTVACGAVSGFHATQSPVMARCLTSEREGRTVFYGAMVVEGVIALIWAAAGVTFYQGVGPLYGAISELGQGGVVYDIATTLLGPAGGVLAMLGVIVCPVTSGDTAFRAIRLSLADWFHLSQKKASSRLLLTVPLLAASALLCQLDFSVIWRYFSWANQTLAMIVLWAGAVFLLRYGFPKIASLMCALPATFMSAVSMTYLIQAPEGFHLSVSIAYPVGLLFALVCLVVFWLRSYRTTTPELGERGGQVT